jgi:chemotaxis signal transduction protein/methyl-accepting chemotaxis protein
MNDAANSLAQLADTLKTSTNAQKSAEEVAAAAEQLSANAEEVKSASGQISTAISEISRSAQLSARACEASVALGNRLEHAAKEMGRRSTESSERCTVITSLLLSNKEATDEMIVNIGNAAVVKLASAKNVLELEERTRRIDKIVDAIVMVTVQTRMLAVNGNVEAARAGEFGRGFSVVAGDIRSLANESSENADRIKDLVKSIQGQITKVVADIEGSRVNAREEAERAKVSTANLERMASDIKLVQAGVKEILRGSEESVTALQQASIASEQIATAAEQMNRSSVESATASEQGLRAAEEILQAVEEIASQADELQHGYQLGLVVDHVNEVLGIQEEAIEAPPAVSQKDGFSLSGIAKLDDGNRLILLLSTGNLLDKSVLANIADDASDAIASKALKVGDKKDKEAEQVGDCLQFVTFLLGDEEYGIPIAKIQEIDRLSRITQTPKAPKFVEGVTNLRGEVIPVLSTRALFALEAKAPGDRTRVIIVDLAGTKTGLVVDSVKEVLSISTRNIAPPPLTISSGEDAQFISGIGKVDDGKRMIVLLDVERVMTRGEQGALASLSHAM